MTNTLRKKLQRLVLGAALPAAGLSMMALAAPAQGKTLGVHIRLQNGSQFKVADWSHCSNQQPIIGVAEGWTELNQRVCTVESRGNTVTTSCPETAFKHNSFWKAGSITSPQSTPFSVDWHQDRELDLGSPNASEGAFGPCTSRNLKIADMGG